MVSPVDKQGLYKFSVDEYGTPQLLFEDAIANGGGFEAWGGDYYGYEYYFTYFDPDQQKAWNRAYYISNWSYDENYVANSLADVCTTIAYSPERDDAYGCARTADGSGYNFVRSKGDNGFRSFYSKTIIASLERPWAACAFDSKGVLYAIEQNGDLYTVETFNGEMTKVGSTGVESTGAGDAAIDPETGVMYWSVSNDSEKALYKVDVESAQATKLYDFAGGEELCGMYFPGTAYTAPEGAPGKSSIATLSFPNGSLTGTIQFQKPSTATDYCIKANGVEIKSGAFTVSGSGYERVTDLTVPKTDNYYITVTTSNESGTSAAVGKHVFVGPDVPTAPTNFTGKQNGSKIDFTWYAPSTTGLNGGAISSDAFRYTITRYPDEKVIAQDIATRSASDEDLPDPDEQTDYYYVLSTTANGVSAPDVSSSVFTFGPLELPQDWKFNSSTATNGWTLIPNTDVSYSSYYGALAFDTYSGLDHYVISPVVRAKANATYPVTVKVKANMYFTYKFEVVWGTAPTVEAMVNKAFEYNYTDSSEAEKEFSGEFTCDVNGKIYIGVHVYLEDRGMAEAYIFGINVGEGVIAAAPAAVENLTVTPAADGSLSADIKFTLPENDNDGAKLNDNSALTKVEIFRDDKSIKTYGEADDLEAGKEIEYTDNDEELTNGLHTYSVVATNRYGDSDKAEAEVFVGVCAPAVPTGVKFIENGNTGEVTISWDPVTTDENGDALIGTPTYRVFEYKNSEMVEIAKDLTETSYVHQAVEPGAQKFVQFAVTAVNAGGETKMAASAYSPAGTPSVAPWSESFANATTHSLFGYNYILGRSGWYILGQSEDWVGLSSQDDDGGLAYFEAWNAYTALVTGKIDLSNLKSPVLSYYVFNYQTTFTPSNVMEIDVDCGDGNGYVSVNETRISNTGAANTWNKVYVDLSAYAGKTVSLRFVPKYENNDINNSISLFAIDNIRVEDDMANNLVATNITAPTVVDLNKPFEVEVMVSNEGRNDVASYTVSLLKGEEVQQTSRPQSLNARAVRTHTFEVTLNFDEEDFVELYGLVNFESDENEEDNLIGPALVGTNYPIVPVVNDLAGTYDDNGVVLTWSEPNLDTAAPAATEEGFEKADSWKSIVEGWKFIDNDKGRVMAPNITGFPIAAGSQQTWFVIDNTWNFPATVDLTSWESHSGKKFMGSLSVQDNTESMLQSDDWAITPRLYGGEQILSFYAKSFEHKQPSLPEYPESFEVLASSNTTNMDDFEVVGSAKNIAFSWTQFRFKLPEGTKYAAIRSRSIDKYILLVDDVKFIAADGPDAQLTISGYNVYRDGEKITSKPVTECNYTDASGKSTNKYFVTTVYTDGESRASNIAELQKSSGVAEIATDNMGVRIYSVAGGVEVKGLTEGSVKVYTTDGRKVAEVSAQPELKISLVSGIYVVTTDVATVKLVVR